MKQFRAMKAVYCYYLPETRPLLREVEAALPDEMWFVNSQSDKIKIHLDPLFDPPLLLPETPEGNLSLDEIHVPVIKRIISAYSLAVPHLNSFAYPYPTSGSSEGIFHSLAKLKTEGLESIYLLSGEYEGYAEYAGHLGMKVKWIDPLTDDVGLLQPGRWFISNPSARDGNIIPNEFINNLCEAGHRVSLDLSYVGSTADYSFDTLHRNIDTVFLSFSKPYGVFRFRIGGFVFARNVMPSLFGNKWFKDITRLLQALKLAESIGPHSLHKKYFPIQSAIINDLNRDFGLGLVPSDSFLLAHVNETDAAKLSQDRLDILMPYRRGSGYRLCLTPYFEMRNA